MTSETKGEIFIVAVFAALGLWLLFRPHAAAGGGYDATPLPSPSQGVAVGGMTDTGVTIPPLLGGNVYTYNAAPLTIAPFNPGDYAAGQAASCGCGGGAAFTVFGTPSAFQSYVASLPGVDDLQSASEGKWF